MSEFNNQKMTEISDSVIRALKLCRVNKNLWKTEKVAMLRLIEADNQPFYETYPRICRMLVYAEDISPLLGMIKTFGLVQSGKLEFSKANDSISNALNSQYIDNVLYSDPLVKEREAKIKAEKEQKVQMI